MREFRARLAATVARVTGTGSPVFVGGYRKPEVVVMSVEQYESLVGAARQREAVAEALRPCGPRGSSRAWRASGCSSGSRTRAR